MTAASRPTTLPGQPPSGAKLNEGVPVMSERSLRWLLVGALVFSLLWVALPIPLFDVDEGAFSEATREMLASGDLITTRLNGELRFDKPILIYWCQALSASVFGFNEFAMRLPSALAAIVWVLALVRFGSSWTSERRGMLAGILLISSLQVSLVAKAAIADSLLNMFLALSMFAGYQYSRTGEKRQVVFCYVFAAFGFLTKGPVALLIPLATAFLLYLVRKDPGGFVRGVFNPLGIALFLLIAAPWYLLEYMAQGPAFIEGFFLTHNVARFRSPFEGHGGSLFYYVPVVLLGILPFTGVLLASLRHVRAWLRSDLERFCLIWFLFVLVLFSLSGTKLHHYVVYGYTPLFLLLAGAVDRLKSSAWAVLPAAAALLFFLFVPELSALLRPRVDDEFARVVMQHVPAVFRWQYRLVLLLCLGILGGVFLQRRFSVAFKTALAGIITAGVVNATVLPAVAHLMQSPVKQAGLLLRGDSDPVVMWRSDNPNLSFYARRIVPEAPPQAGDRVFTRVTELSDLPFTLVPEFQRYGYVLGRLEEPRE